LRHGNRRQLLAAGLAAVSLTAVIAIAATALNSGGAGPGLRSPGPANATGTGPPTPPGTALVARLAVGGNPVFSWAPDGRHLLVSDDTGSRVYDRFGKLVSESGPIEGWLDAGHLISGDGTVTDIASSHPATSPAGSSVLANGYGSAVIVPARPAQCGDPTVEWYRGGSLDRSSDAVTPLGWSVDGRYVVLGHETCDGSVPTGSWQGQVQVVEFASGRVLATLPGVRGEVAFSPDGGSIAAQSGADLEVADLDTGGVDTVPAVRFLGWLDQESLFAAHGSQIEFIDLDPLDISSAVYVRWQASSPQGLHLAGDLTGAALAVLAADGSQLIDLSTAGLTLEPSASSAGAAGAGGAVATYLQQNWWSPDGGMLAIESSDGATIALLSVDPSHPGSPVGSPVARDKQETRSFDRVRC
jgi:WD40 repeat protein